MGYPPDLGWGTPQDLGLGTPPRPGTGYPPGPGTGYPPPQTRSGLDRAAQQVLATRRAVCLLRSRRRTFLLKLNFLIRINALLMYTRCLTMLSNCTELTELFSKLTHFRYYLMQKYLYRHVRKDLFEGMKEFFWMMDIKSIHVSAAEFVSFAYLWSIFLKMVRVFPKISS